jgi:hypothetical protein
VSSCYGTVCAWWGQQYLERRIKRGGQLRDTGAAGGFDQQAHPDRLRLRPRAHVFQRCLPNISYLLIFFLYFPPLFSSSSKWVSGFFLHFPAKNNDLINSPAPHRQCLVSSFVSFFSSSPS